jgi:hypothetical protein
MADNTEQDERTLVLRQYASATEHYAWTVGELERHRGKPPKHKYDQLFLEVEKARSECERLRKALLSQTTSGDT